MRKKSREVADFKAKLDIINQCDVCRVALNDGPVPYIVPMNFFMTENDGDVTLWFHCANEGKKLDLIAENPNCCFEMDCSHELVSDRSMMYCTMQYSSIIGTGRIEVVPEAEKRAALQLLNDRYHKDGFPVNEKSLPNVTVLRLRVAEMTGKSNVGKINIPSYLARTDKNGKYEQLYAQVKSVLEGETDPVAMMSNMAAMIHAAFGFWWTGFYIVKNDELVLGPFQGPMACMHIKFGRGVCGTAWKENRTIVVPDVEEFPGHIACSSESRSEIVVPVRKDGVMVCELDIDSRELACFDDVDAMWLERITSLLSFQ